MQIFVEQMGEHASLILCFELSFFFAMFDCENELTLCYNNENTHCQNEPFRDLL